MSGVAWQGGAMPGFEPLLEAFEEAFVGHPGMGAALAVRVDGESVIDVWGGYADPRAGRLWESGTLGVVFSCTKGLMSILAAQLVQRGLLDYDAPVARYWPEFAAAGKAETTVRHLLAHRAGLPALRTPLTTEQMLDWGTVTAALAEQEPLWQPGARHSYHPITHGWLIGEVVRRVTGLMPGEAFRRFIAEPLGAPAWIGLPDEHQARVAHLTVGPTLRTVIAEGLERAPAEGPDWPSLAMTMGGALPLSLAEEGAGFNDPRVRAAQIPGAGGVMTARALARIWSATVVDDGGVRLLEPSVLEDALPVRSHGAPYFDAPPPWPAWGSGFQRDSEARRYLGEASFGHDGAGGQVAFADAEHRVGFAFVTNWMEAVDPRATRIVDALRECLA